MRSSDFHLVKCSGLRGLNVCLLTPLPWGARVWALPVLTVLAPSFGWAKQQGRRHKEGTVWARQAVLQLAHWLPNYPLICLGKSGYAVLTLLAATRAHTTWLTRLRLDAVLYEPAPERVPSRRSRPRVKSARLPGLAQVAAAASTNWLALTLPADARGQARQMELATSTALWYSTGTAVPVRWVLVRPVGESQGDIQALLSTDLALEAATILTTYALRWALEVTFTQVRAHLWTWKHSGRGPSWLLPAPPPMPLGLFSLVTLLVNRLHARGLLRAQACAWYHKQAHTFRDAPAAVRRYLWAETLFDNSPADPILLKIPHHQLRIWQQALAWAAQG